MPICRSGWWLSTTLMWTSTTCGPERRSLCRRWRPSIASEAASLEVPGQSATSIRAGSKSHDGAVRGTQVEFELAARGHAAEGLHREAEVRGLTPGCDRLVRLAAEFRYLGQGQRQRTIIEHESCGLGGAQIARMPVVSGGDVHPQSIAQGTAAIPLDRAEVGEAQARVRNAGRILRARQKFDRCLERPQGHAGLRVERFDRFVGGAMGAAQLKSKEQNDRQQGDPHSLKYTGT